MPSTPVVDEGARVVALARDSEVVYVYWDIPADVLTNARGRLGHGALTGRLVLRAHDLATALDGLGGEDFLEYDVSDSDRDAFIRIAKPGTAQIVEIGLSGDDGSFTSIARSGKVELPRAVPTTWTPPPPSEVRWMSAPPPPPPQPAYVGPAPASVRDMALGAPPVVSAAPPPTWQPEAEVVPTRGSDSSPLVGWGRPGPLGRGASEAWVGEPWTSASQAQPGPTAPSAGDGDDLHVRAPSSPRASAERWSGEAGAATAARPEPAHEAHSPAATDPGRTATALEPPSASVEVHDRHPSAAEGVWSPAEVSDRPAATSPTTALERRQLPATVPSSSTAVAVVKPTTPPGWDQITTGLGALARGVLQVTGGALRVAGGIAKLGAWTVQKALETLRKPKS
ncbi:MAG: DUF4912 domain-containing protein [Deltaproteobacteria bacterium]|nr:DUF4912 domain-containing protein [Deltaproteobacteria bacterium]